MINGVGLRTRAGTEDSDRRDETVGVDQCELDEDRIHKLRSDDDADDSAPRMAAAAAVASRPPSSSCKRTAMYLCLVV